VALSRQPRETVASGGAAELPGAFAIVRFENSARGLKIARGVLLLPIDATPTISEEQESILVPNLLNRFRTFSFLKH